MVSLKHLPLVPLAVVMLLTACGSETEVFGPSTGAQWGTIRLKAPWARSFQDEVSLLEVRLYDISTDEVYGPFRLTREVDEALVRGVPVDHEILIEALAYNSRQVLIGSGQAGPFRVVAGEQVVRIRVNPLPTVIRLLVEWGEYPPVIIESPRQDQGEGSPPVVVTK